MILPYDFMVSILRDESTRVDVVDDLENGIALTTLGHDEEHLHLMTRVEAVSFDDRSTTMGIDSDARGNLAILVRDDEKLHATTHGVGWILKFTAAGSLQSCRL